MLPFCYSVQAHKQAYGHNIMPVRNKAHWEKMDGVEVKPPVYERKVGRPRKSRRRQPHELEGGTKMSQHGVKIHCSHCKDSGHNKKGCKKRKAELAGAKLPFRKKRNNEVSAEVQECPIITLV